MLLFDEDKTVSVGSRAVCYAKRALEVLDLMVKSGMDARRLSAAGYADVLPVATNDTDEGRKQNRRIEIVLVPNLEDLPGIDDKSS